MLKAYMMHAGDSQEGACLVFARNFNQARRLAFKKSMAFDGCEFIDVRGHILKGDWLRDNAADHKLLEVGEAHVIDAPPTCEDCGLWWDYLNDKGLCESCDPIDDDDKNNTDPLTCTNTVKPISECPCSECVEAEIVEGGGEL